ncbi:helix-turn-helix domain-containing protein [Streptomyces sp. NPDC001833]|uniref:sigma-54-dependent Fis family transcriptional regulator n=1 Tax=Streptomyces sp. NPDC001833 TaxID=3154658 RepID=UPI00332AFD4E
MAQQPTLATHSFSDPAATTRTTDMAVRPEIALSWHRSAMSGLTTSTPDIPVHPDAADRRSRLVVAAEPVLAEIADQLGDMAAFCVLLADRDARIVNVPVGAGSLRRRLEGLGGVPGGLFLEETTGTNAIATAHELRQGFAVHGEEHYVEPFKQLSCYGQPVIHPVTHRLEGVLDITCLSRDDSPLLGPFISRAARDIEENLLRTARRTEQRMLSAFQAAARRNRPVLVLGEGVVLANPTATELLDPVDHVRLRELANDLERRVGGSREPCPVRSVELSSGRIVSVRVQVVSPGADGVLFEFPDQGQEERAVVPRQVPRPSVPVPGTPTYVGGPPGTGRSTTAQSLAGAESAEVVILDASDVAAQGEETWLSALERAADGARALVVEDIHLLPEACCVRLRRLMDRCGPGDPWIVLTGAPIAELVGRHAALASGCSSRIDLPPLRDRSAQLPELVRAILRDLGADERIRFTSAALGVLAGHPWPGNLRELHAVVRAVVDNRSAGDVTPHDLPADYRTSPRLRVMTPLERAEHDAIVAALRQCGGNKVHAAKRLGISRTTLYSRIRTLRITT